MDFVKARNFNLRYAQTTVLAITIVYIEFVKSFKPNKYVGSYYSYTIPQI